MFEFPKHTYIHFFPKSPNFLIIFIASSFILLDIKIKSSGKVIILSPKVFEEEEYF